MSIKIHKDGKWQLFPGTGVGGSTNSYTKEESDNKYALKSDVTTVSGKVDDLEERIDQINTGGNCEDCISQSELESAISGVNSKIDNLVTTVSGKVDTGSYLFTLNGDQVNQGDSVNVAGSGTSITIDSVMDPNSENPVQNKVIYNAIDTLTDAVTNAFTIANQKFEDLDGFRTNRYNAIIASGTTQIKWKDVSSTSPLYLKTINGVSIIGNSENDNITISGGSGTVTESKPSVIVFAYIQSNEKPISEPNVTVDSEGNPSYTGEWKSISDMSDAISNKLQIWYSYATFVVGGNIVGSWSDPIPFAKDGLPGQDGTPGKDGIGVEYIYYRSNDNVIPSLPADANSWEWDNVPENAGGWTDNPTGVDKDHQFEFVSVRTGNATNINPWSVPTLWSKYGVNGVDGDTIEYIYALTTDITIQPSTPDNSWEYDNPQLPWHDNPQSVSESDKVCWVSVRKKSGNSDTWGDWSTPAVWSKWSDRFYSALVEVYKRSNSPIEPTNKPGTFTWDFDKSNFAEGVTSNLNDYKLSIEGSGKYLYKCSAYLTSNSNIKLFNSEVWNGPYLVAQNGENGSGQSAVYLDLTNDSSYLVTDINGNVEKEQVINTTLHMYYGTTEQTLTDCFVEGHTNDANVSVNNDIVNKCANISITYPVNTTISDSKLEYTIQAKSIIDGSAVTKTIGFIVVISKPAESGKDAVMYNIVPSATVIKLNSDGEAYIPDELRITVVKVEGAVSTNLSAEQITLEGLSLKYQLDNGDKLDAPEKWQLSFNKSDLDLIGSITFNLYKGTECIDTETVPVLRDGKKGDTGDSGQDGTDGTSPVLLGIDNDHLIIAVANDGKAVANQTLVFYVHLYNGNTEVDANKYNISFNPTSATGYTINSQDNANLKATGKIVIVNITTDYKMPVSGTDEYSIIKVTAKDKETDTELASSNVIVRYSNTSWLEIVPDTYTIHLNKDGNPYSDNIGITIYNEFITDSKRDKIVVTKNQLTDWGYDLIYINDTQDTTEVEHSIINNFDNTTNKFNLNLNSINFDNPIKITFKSNEPTSEIFDVEYITIIRDGQNGSNGSNGYTQQVLQIYQRSTAELTAPNNNNNNYSVSDLINNTWTAPGSWKKEIPTASSKPCYMSTAFISFDASKTGDTISVTWSDPIKILENGTGSDGRMLYPAGIWNSAAPYTRTDTATPFVLYQPTTEGTTPQYYVLIAESSGNTEPGTEGSSEVWKLMESLDVAYANVMMAEMGTIGDATFYNNLMFSKKDAKGNQVIDKGENNPFETVNGTTTIKMGSSNKPTMAIDFNSGEAYFSNGNLKLNSDGHISVANIEYDITNVSSTITDEEQVSNFYYYNIPITDLACVVDSNATITDINGNIIKDPSSASIGDTFISYYFNLPNKYIEDKTTVSEGVVINTGDYKIDIIVKNKYNIYYQGNHITNKVILQPKSIMKYYYYYMSDSADLLFIDVLGVKSTTQEGVLIIGKE